MNKETEKIKIDRYFELRNAIPDELNKNDIPPIYLSEILPTNKNIKILDIGCGHGLYMNSLKNIGYENILGVDINKEAIEYCKERDLNVELIENIENFSKNNKQKFDFIILTHVIEHIKKDEIIENLKYIKELLDKNGILYITTPNAQAQTGFYWMSEDFTHEFIFTTGSMNYCLKASGLNNVEFLDIYGIENLRFKILRKNFIRTYRYLTSIKNRLLGIDYHKKSTRIDTWEMKLIAKK